RRRHTRFSRDWSSDVCSSDLEVTIRSASFGAYDEGDTGSVGVVSRKPPSYPTTAALLYASSDVYVVLKIGRAGEVLDVAVEQVRSEERRVGKGGGAGGWGARW